MQRIFMGSGATVTNANKLNCTANDIRISRAISVNPSSCQASGDPNNPALFDLEATFEVVVTANSRYDAAFFFRTDGGADARGTGANATGICSLSWLTVPAPVGSDSPALELDGDTCGDLNSGTYTVTFTIEDVACVDTDGDGFLNLPNCTSWHSNQGTVCDAPANAADLDVFDFHPDTKAKCVCDDNFEVPVTVESPSGATLKKATNARVTYEVKVKNNSATRTVKINSLTDDLYGDITQVQGPVKTTNCNTLIGDQLAPGATSDACQFTVDYAHPGTSGPVTDNVSAEIEDTVSGTKVTVSGGSATIDVDLNATPAP